MGEQKYGTREPERLVSLPVEKLLPIIRETLDCGGRFVLTVTGNSMAPTLHHLRDKVELVAPTQRAPARGEIVLFRRTTGECILHRVIGWEGQRLRVNGDAQSWTETILPEQIIGVVARISRDGRWVRCDSRRYRVYVWIWQAAKPVRPAVQRLAAAVKKRK